MLSRDSYKNATTLSRFIIKRDMIRLPIWIICTALFMVLLVPVFDNMLITTGTDRTVMVEMMKNPAMIAVVGPIYGEANYTLGAAYANYMLLFSVMIAGIMNIFLVNRHTRQDEELGRLEVVRSLPVGRLASPLSVVIVAILANIILTILTFIGLIALKGEGMNAVGCLVYASSLGVVGMFFAVTTLLFCQLTGNNRTAMGMSFFFMLFLYVLRAVGDVGNETLSLISPLGLILRTENFVNDKFWPIIVIKIITIILLFISLYINSKRDLGSGVFAERAGRRHASSLLTGPLSLAIKLLKTSIIIWAFTIFILAAMYGSVFGDLEGYIESSDMLRAIFDQSKGISFTEQFTVLLIAIMSLLGSIPIINFINRLSYEEKNGMMEHVLSKATSRNKQMASYLSIAIVTSVIYQIISAYGFWVVGSAVMPNITPLKDFIIASLLYLPAIWVLIGLASLLIGIMPRLTSLTYVYLGYSFIAVYFGKIAGFPEWFKALTPYGYISGHPLEDINWTNQIVLLIIFILMTSIGFISYRKRDLQQGH